MLKDDTFFLAQVKILQIVFELSGVFEHGQCLYSRSYDSLINGTHLLGDHLFAHRGVLTLIKKNLVRFVAYSLSFLSFSIPGFSHKCPPFKQDYAIHLLKDPQSIVEISIFIEMHRFQEIAAWQYTQRTKNGQNSAGR